MLSIVATQPLPHYLDPTNSGPNYDSPPHSVREFDAHDHLFFEGDEANSLFELLEGFVCIYKVLSDGRRHVVSFHFPGDMIGLLELGTYPYNAEALSPCKVRSQPLYCLREALKTRPGLGEFLIRKASAELAAAQDHLLTLARKTAIERLSGFLLNLSKKNEANHQDPRTVFLPMTRSDIADFLGLTVETVSRNLGKLKQCGVIDLPQSSKVVILDMDELKFFAENAA